MTTKKTNDELKSINQQTILHPATSIVQLMDQGPRIMTEGKGIYLKDSDGNEVMDGIAGLWCVNIGYGNEELADAMADAARTMGYYHTFTACSNEPQIELAEQLVPMAPGKLNKVFFGSSGSDANDTIVKIVWHYNNLKGRPEKKKIIARDNAYHGTNISGASLTGLKGFHNQFDLPIKNIIHTGNPHYYAYCEAGESEEAFAARRVRELEEMILAEGPDTVAAFIAEPIMGAGGVINPPKGYFEGVKAVLKKYDILMIADEVICGYGRIGYNFASELYNIEPDLMASAKALTSGYFPMSATYITDEIWETLRYGSETLGGFSHGYTYSGHPIGCAVALKNLEIMKRLNLTQNASEVGAYLHERLAGAFGNHPHVGEVRGHGLLAAVQMVVDRDPKKFFNPACKIPARVADACYQAGLIVRPLPSIGAIALSPPLIMTKENVDQMVDKITLGLNEVMDNLSTDDKA